jgi:hypothetical protein
MMQVATFEGDTWKHEDGAAPNLDKPVDRETLITVADVRRAQKRVLPDPARRSKHDGMSIALAIADAEQGSILLYKSIDHPAPVNSDVRDDSYLLIWQTSAQKAMLREFGRDSIWFIDATYNCTTYDGLLLTSLLVKDQHGRGTLFCHS